MPYTAKEVASKVWECIVDGEYRRTFSFDWQADSYAQNLLEHGKANEVEIKVIWRNYVELD